MTIEIKNLSKTFKDNEVITDISTTFKSGKIYGLYGRNGAGKSVFLKLLCGFYVPTSGKILYDNVDFNSKCKFPPNLRALIEKPSFYPDLTGFENLKSLAKIQNKIGDKEILKALEIVNLTNEKDKKYSKYSLGMKQKLGIAQVIMEEPNIMIFDEPFNGIERQTVLKLIDYLNKEKKEGKLIIISTHIKEDLEKLADEIYYFDSGKVINKEIINEEKINYNLPILNNLLNRKHNLIIFLLILIGVIVPSVSGNPFATLYEKIYAILTNPLFNFFFFLAVGISCIYAKCEFSKSYNLISRVGNYKKFIKENIKYIFIETIFWYIIAIILSLSGAFLLCLGEYGLVNHPNYDFNILYYLIFFCIRGSVIAGLVNVIIYLISNFLKNKFTIVLLLALNILFLIVTKQNTINNFYNMSILYHNYFLNINYVSFLLEVLCTFLECTLLLMIKKFMFKVIISKKRDLV